MIYRDRAALVFGDGLIDRKIKLTAVDGGPPFDFMPGIAENRESGSSTLQWVISSQA